MLFVRAIDPRRVPAIAIVTFILSPPGFSQTNLSTGSDVRHSLGVRSAECANPMSAQAVTIAAAVRISMASYGVLTWTLTSQHCERGGRTNNATLALARYFLPPIHQLDT